MFLLLYLLHPTLQEIIAQSQINKCYANTTNSTNCNDKMLITLTVENSQNITTEYIKINETTIENQTSTLKTPIVISVTKTPVYAYYKLKYKSDYNSQPYEVKIPVSILSCDDSWNSKSPTCGFQYDSNKQKIFDSQGFCCSCGILDIIGLSDEFARGNICSQAGLSSASMAFCLRYSPLWYSAYEILTYSIYYNISITVTYFNEETEELHLGTEVKTVQGQSLIARVIGDFTPLNPPPSLESFYLMKPTSPASHARVQAGSAAYMIVSKELIGNGECNKIGVTYTAFRTEADSCKKQVKSCLKNQIEDLYQADLKLISNNSQPDYLLQKYGKFKQVNINNDTFLSYNIEGSMQTMITLEINTTGRIQFVVNLGKGKIDFAEVQNFEAKSGNGLLYAQITNVGDIASEFSTYLNCSINVIPINVISLYLDSLQSQIIQQEVNVLSDMNKSNKCNFSLLNNQGTLLDWKEITFNTTQIQQESTQEHAEQETQSNEVLATDELINQCDTGCSVFFDIKCYILNDCNQQIITFFTVLGCTFLLIFMCFLCKSCRKQVCCCFYKKKKQKFSYIPKIKIDNNNDFNNSSKNESILESLMQENKLMYLNLAFGTDPIPNHLESDISVEVLALYQNKKLQQLKMKKNCQFVETFKEVYGYRKVDTYVKQYLEQKLESIMLFNNLLTEYPLFCIY